MLPDLEVPWEITWPKFPYFGDGEPEIPPEIRGHSADLWECEVSLEQAANTDLTLSPPHSSLWRSGQSGNHINWNNEFESYIFLKIALTYNSSLCLNSHSKNIVRRQMCEKYFHWKTSLKWWEHDELANCAIFSANIWIRPFRTLMCVLLIGSQWWEKLACCC